MEEIGLSLDNASLDMLGTARKIEIDKELLSAIFFFSARSPFLGGNFFVLLPTRFTMNFTVVTLLQNFSNYARFIIFLQI